jgi:hypothetical protein
MMPLSPSAAVLGGFSDIWIKPGFKVLHIGAAAGTSVNPVSDIVGPSGAVYAVEFSRRPGRDLINMAKSCTNVIPTIEDARHPLKSACWLVWWAVSLPMWLSLLKQELWRSILTTSSRMVVILSLLSRRLVLTVQQLLRLSSEGKFPSCKKRISSLWNN